MEMLLRYLVNSDILASMKGNVPFFALLESVHYKPYRRLLVIFTLHCGISLNSVTQGFVFAFCAHSSY